MLCVLWGSTFTGMKIALRHWPPLTLGAVRYLIAGVLVMALVKRSAWPRDLRPYLWFAFLGVLNSGLLAGMLLLGMRDVSAGRSSVLVNTHPLLVAVLAYFFLGETLRQTKIAGLVVGFGGVLLMAQEGLRAGSGSARGYALILGAAVVWAVSSIVFKRVAGSHDVTVVAGVQLLAGGIFLALGALATETGVVLRSPVELWVALLYIAIPGMAFPAVLWYYLLARGEAGKVTAWLFLVPTFGVLFGWLTLGEGLSWWEVAGAVLVAAGIYLVNRRTDPIVVAPEGDIM
ncbi:MAG: DMT family transporter [Thermoleophilia bacterium]